MSISIQTLVWKSALSGNAMLIMQAVADVADDDGLAYPSVAYIAWKTGLARSTVQAILGGFRENNLLIQQSAGDGAQTSRYRIATENLPVKDPWLRLKGRLPGQSGREVPPSPKIGHGVVGDPARNTEAPCPIQQGTLPGIAKRNKEDTSGTHQRYIGSTHPSLEEVKQYCTERNRGVDPERWFNHYQANGWKVGRTAMKDWRAAVRTWETSEYSGNGHKPQKLESDILTRLRAQAGTPVDRSKEL